MSQTTLDQVNTFMEQNKKHYQELLDGMKSLCTDLKKTLDDGTIREIYTRADKQEYSHPFKTNEKIAKALARERTKNPNFPPRDITDIIGLTVIVYYPSQINFVTKKILKHIKHFDVKKDELKKANGYYAHHLVLQSLKGKTSGLHCEIQIKTMLHDSWGAKTHDLNYKPQGNLDTRYSRIMQFFGDALQAIEEQSDVMRDIITEGWTRNAEQIHAVREHMFRLVPVAGGTALKLSKKGEQIRKEIHRIGQTAPLASNAKVDKIEARITHSTSPRDAAWLALYLAMFHIDPAHESQARQRVNDLTPHIEGLLRAGEMSEDEAVSLPLALEIVDQEDAAMELSAHLIRLDGCLSAISLSVLKFNLANGLVKGCLRGSPKSTAELNDVRRKVEDLLKECADFAADDPSATADLRGMLAVATSDDPAAVREAITLIEQGIQGVKAGDEDFARACYELNARIAWRRLLELEDRDAASKRLAQRRPGRDKATSQVSQSG